MSTNPPAFPSLDVWEEHCEAKGAYRVTSECVGGMSLRDYFAAKALPSTLSASASRDGSYDYVAAAIGAYMVADAMLKEREK